MSVFPLYGPKGSLAVVDRNKDGVFNVALDVIKTAPEAEVNEEVTNERLAAMGLELKSLEGVRLEPLSEYLSRLLAAESTCERGNADMMHIFLRSAKDEAKKAGVPFGSSRADAPAMRECYKKGAKDVARRGEDRCEGYDGDLRAQCIAPFKYKATLFGELGGTYADELLVGHAIAKKIFFGLMYLGALSGTKRDISEGNLNHMISSNLELLDAYARKGGFEPSPGVSAELYTLGYEHQLKEAKDSGNKFDREMNLEMALEWAKEGGIKADRARISKIKSSKLGPKRDE